MAQGRKRKRFEIKQSVSGAAWGSVDQSALWKRLKDGLDESVDGAAEAVAEMYAVVKSAIGPGLKKTDCLFPHHEIREDGGIVLNKAALIAAAAEFAKKAGSLTEAQREAARRHLLRHFEELEEDPPESLAGEMRVVEARITGEIKPEDIPPAPGVDLDAIKAGDDDPLEVVVEIPPGKSTRGWNYQEQSLKEIVGRVNTQTLPGYLGHQKPEDVSTEFPTPVTHWVGAVWKDGKAYVRGVVDKAASNLKRWIRAKRVNQVSIFGLAKLRQVGSETHVVGFDAYSIDWTPLGRAGMPTRVVAVGEMDSTFPALVAEFDGSYEAIREEIQGQVQAAVGKYAWVRRLFPTYAIVEVEAEGGGPVLYRYPYVVMEKEVILGEPVEVEEERTYVPVGEMGEGGREGMGLKEMLAAIRSAIAKGETNYLAVLGEIGVTKEQAIELLAGEQMQALKAGDERARKLASALGLKGDEAVEAAEAVAAEMAATVQALGFNLGEKPEGAAVLAAEMLAVWKALGFDQSKPEKPAELAAEMAKAWGDVQEAARQKRIDDAIKAKVAGEQAQALVKRMLKVAGDATEEQIAAEIDALLADEAVKGVLGKLYVDKPAGVGGGTAGGSGHQYVRAKTVSL